MKINWGFGIIISFMVFIGMTAFMVITSMNQDIDLVADDYYEKTLVYQDQINKMERTSAMEHRVEITQPGENVNIKFPQEFINKKIEGEIYFYRPSDAKRDFKIQVALNSGNEQSIDGAALAKGLWRVKLNWKADSFDYYYEQILLVN